MLSIIKHRHQYYQYFHEIQKCAIMEHKVPTQYLVSLESFVSLLVLKAGHLCYLLTKVSNI